MKKKITYKNKAAAIMSAILVLIYAVAPDFVPGPIDDALLIILSFLGNVQFKDKNE